MQVVELDETSLNARFLALLRIKPAMKVKGIQNMLMRGIEDDHTPFSVPGGLAFFSTAELKTPSEVRDPARNRRRLQRQKFLMRSVFAILRASISL